MLAGFGGAIEALRAADAMDADEVHDWNNRMHVALGLEPLDPLPPGFKGARAVFIGEGEPGTPSCSDCPVSGTDPRGRC